MSILEKALLAITAQQPKERTAVWMVGEQLKDMIRAEPHLAEIVEQDLAVKAMSLSIDDIMDEAGLPLIGIVPEDPRVPLAARSNRPLLLYSPRKVGATAAFYNIGKRIEGIHAPLTLR